MTLGVNNDISSSKSKRGRYKLAKARGETSAGPEPNLTGLLCYVLGWVTGLVFLLLEKDRFVRFHAIQSVVVFGVLNLAFNLILIPIIGWVFGWLIILLALVLWVVLMVRAYQGFKTKVPLAGNFAEKRA